MTKYIKLKYCPRTKPIIPSPLKKPIHNCKYNSKKQPGVTHIGECHYWTMKGLIQYCKDNKIKIEFSTRCLCVLYSDGLVGKDYD